MGYKFNYLVLIKIIVIINDCNFDIYVFLFMVLKGDGYYKFYFFDDVLFFLMVNKLLMLRYK